MKSDVYVDALQFSINLFVCAVGSSSIWTATPIIQTSFDILEEIWRTSQWILAGNQRWCTGGTFWRMDCRKGWRTLWVCRGHNTCGSWSSVWSLDGSHVLQQRCAGGVSGFPLMARGSCTQICYVHFGVGWVLIFCSFSRADGHILRFFCEEKGVSTLIDT